MHMHADEHHRVASFQYVCLAATENPVLETGNDLNIGKT